MINYYEKVFLFLDVPVFSKGFVCTGPDLPAWIYEMFSPEEPYTNRDLFPGGEGVNRRIGFSDLTAEGQDYLKNQKYLS